MENDLVTDPAGLESGDLFSEQQITQPLLISILIGIACYFTFDYFYEINDLNSFPDRYLGNGFCKIIVFVFVIGTCYAVLHYLGLFIERYHLQLFSQKTASQPPFYSLLCFLSGRQDSDEDGFFKAVRRWYDSARSSEDFANLSDHLLLLREQQHQHNFALLSFIIWVMPLLGFIGTVIGITQAISGLEEVVAVSGMPTGGGLENVLSGLRFAFDTTFMGLILVIPTMLYTLPLRVKAQKLDMCYHEILLNRLFHNPDDTP